MKKTILFLILIISLSGITTMAQVVEINKPDSINVLSWGNVEVTQDNNYHVQLVTTREKAAIIISNQITARQNNVLTLPDGEYIIKYTGKAYVINYSDSLYQWTRVVDCRQFVKKLVYSYLNPH
jgi:hypothetical protein